MSDQVCMRCGSRFEAEELLFKCPKCGGHLEWQHLPAFDPERILPKMPGLWRYKEFFPEVLPDTPLTLGEGWTPIVSVPGLGSNLLFKLEYISPTASFKDRGVALVINRLYEHGITEFADDSSGNAGASMAAYGAMAGMTAHIFSPSYAPAGKIEQIRAFGADLTLVPGPRPEATKAALAMADSGVFYASHAWVPINLVGQQTAAFEVWEQLQGNLPDAIAMPVGQGTLFLGMYRGFQRLLEAGIITRIPRMIAVQSEKIQPIVQAFESSRDEVTPAKPDYTIADGMAITTPVRGKEILAAIRESKGKAVAVTEEEIEEARKELASNGLFVEPTSAAPFAAVPKFRSSAGERVLVMLTGSGLKKLGR